MALHVGKRLWRAYVRKRTGWAMPCPNYVNLVACSLQCREYFGQVVIWVDRLFSRFIRPLLLP